MLTFCSIVEVAVDIVGETAERGNKNCAVPAMTIMRTPPITSRLVLFIFIRQKHIITKNIPPKRDA